MNVPQNISKLDIDKHVPLSSIDYSHIRFAMVEEDDERLEIHYCPIDARIIINKSDISILINGLKSYLND